MAALGPFEPAPRLAVGVSGGADSMALAWLADRWATQRGGRVLALIVDHGLRPEAAIEAAQTAAQLAARGIAAEILPIAGLVSGPDLSARARAARYDALEAACARHGVLHLLVAHHAADQAETIAMRMLAGSGADGLAGMATLVARRQVSLLRPLLVVPPAALRELLRGIGWSWVEDPSNRDLRWHRAVLRGLRRDSDGRGPATRSLVAAATRRQLDRAARARATAEELAAKVAFHPEGFAIMASGPIGVPALQAVLRVIGGRGYAVSASRVTSLANDPRPATIGGVRLLPAGRLGPAGSLLAVRELATISEAASVRRDLPFAVRRALQSAAFEPAAPAT